MRNFFFFLDGDLLGDSSPSCSPASAGSSASPASASASAASAAAGAEAESSAGSAGASEGSSGVKSGRVCLRVAASLSSLKVCSGRDSGWELGGRRRRESAIREWPAFEVVRCRASSTTRRLQMNYKTSRQIHCLPLKTHRAQLTSSVF